MTSAATKTDKAHIIVFGNEKGGSGKSTSAMHTAIALARLGYNIATIDLDARQGTLTRYMQNRMNYSDETYHKVPLPPHRAISQSIKENTAEQKAEERFFIETALYELTPAHDFIVIDTPGTDNHLSRLGHSCADTLITPLNDSLVDIDVLARIDPKTHEIVQPSVYTLMVEEQNLQKIEDGGLPMHWIVMRNRLSRQNTKNSQTVGRILEKLSNQLGFELVPGFGERVIFRELFLKGLTLLDLKEEETPLTLSQLAARQEVRQLICAIGPEKIKGYAKPPTG
ncbi:MAG: AAA family ATPase [Rhodospirillales bacterium]|nr:AAA family ATPase [Rhodospirillales bacterium]MCB9996371.1 AAA family ATPase [Rhodospirillales bacterium]